MLLLHVLMQLLHSAKFGLPDDNLWDCKSPLQVSYTYQSVDLCCYGRQSVLFATPYRPLTTLPPLQLFVNRSAEPIH